MQDNFTPQKSRKINPFVLIGAAGAVFVVAAIVVLYLLFGRTTKTFKEENVRFSPISDPVCEAVYNFTEEFDQEHLSVLTDSLTSCNVTVTYNSKEDLVMSVVVTDPESGKPMYERYLEDKGEGYYNINLKFYNSEGSYILAECFGELNDFRTELEKEREDVTYENCFENQHLSYAHDTLYFSNGTYTTKAIKQDNLAGELRVTDYWSNGQTKLFKKYVAEEDKWKIKEAANYKEDGSDGNPIEIYTLLKGRWIGFSSNLYRTWSNEPIYLILRPSKDDWRKGRAFVCSSSSACKTDYRFYEKGSYSIDESDYIKLYAMKNAGGGKCDTKRWKIGGTASKIVLTGKYEKISSRFVSDINVNSRSWFKNSIQKKYKVY